MTGTSAFVETTDATTSSNGSLPGGELRVGWLGPLPQWLELEQAQRELDHVHVRSIPLRKTWRGLALDGEIPPGMDVLHGRRPILQRLRQLRSAQPAAAVVLDITDDEDNGALKRWEARSARYVELILAGSALQLRELRRLYPMLAPRTVALKLPLDLTAYAPEAAIHETRNRDLRRFRRLHRLASPAVLFAGPYTPSGGLDIAIESIGRIRKRLPDLRLAAIPLGEIDKDYLDRCERKALSLGHHGIIEWDVEPGDIPLWYASTDVVCLPCREPVRATAATLAAAAGVPFVGSEIEPLLATVTEGETGNLVPVADVGRFTLAIERLLEDAEEGERMGANARMMAESDLSPAQAAKTLRDSWLRASAAHGRQASSAG